MAFPITSTLRRNLFTNWLCSGSNELILYFNFNIHSWSPTRAFLEVTSFILVELLFAENNPIFFMSWGSCWLTYYAFEHMLFLAGYIWRSLINRYFKFAAETDKGSLSIIGPCYLQSSVSGVQA